MSPAVTFDGRTWVMYFVDLPTKTIRRRTASAAAGPWSGPEDVSMPAAPAGKDHWHVTARDVGGRVVLLVSYAAAGSPGGACDLYFGWSDDGGSTFSRAASPVLAHDSVVRAGGDWHRSIYRSGFAFIADGGQTRVGIWYTSSMPTSPAQWRLGYTEAVIPAAAPVRYTTATRPVADAAWSGRQLRVKDPGAPEELHFCRETSTDGVYEWIVIAY
jgi:hypothetical protein